VLRVFMGAMFILVQVQVLHNGLGLQDNSVEVLIGRESL